VGTAKPLVIAAFFGHRTLGDFVMNQVAAASVAAAAGPKTKLLSIYRGDRPYKDLVNFCNPAVSRTLRLSESQTEIVPLEWLEGTTEIEGAPKDQEWYAEGYNKPDLILVPAQMRIEHCIGKPPPLVFPDNLAPAMEGALAQLGLDKSKWFAVVHLRENSYEHRRDVCEERSVNPLLYLPALKRILSEHGGQIVRIGDPSMKPLPKMDGLIDLTQTSNSFPLQAFALSRARFFFGTDSGPTQLASAFKTPVASTNAFGIAVWNDGDVILNKRVFKKSGKEVPPRELFEMGTWTVHRNWPSVTTIKDNSPKQLIDVVDHMVETTQDCRGWRNNSPYTPGPPQDIRLPLEWRELTDIADLTLWE